MSKHSLGEQIAGTPNLYAWGDDQLIKLFGEGAPKDWVEHMAQTDRALHAAGLPVPAAGDIVEIDGSLGLVYERIDGGSIADELLGPVNVDADRIIQLARTFAQVHAKIHESTGIPELPSQKQVFQMVIQSLPVLPADLKEATLTALDQCPAGNRLCHGDFHPYNVLLSSRGPIVIDWNNAHIGNPLEDVARSKLMLDGVAMSQPSLSSGIELFANAYLERYRQLQPFDPEELEAWRPIVAAVRLTDNIPELQEWLLAEIRSGVGSR